MMKIYPRVLGFAKWKKRNVTRQYAERRSEEERKAEGSFSKWYILEKRQLCILSLWIRPRW